MTEDKVYEVVDLQKQSFADMAAYGLIWPASYLKNHIRIFTQGQFYAEVDGKLVGSSSSLIITLKEDYEDHSWAEVTDYGLFSNHNPSGDSLYGADISVHPDYQKKGIGTLLYNARKDLSIKRNLRRIVAGGRLFNYYKYAKMMSPYEYARKVVKGELKDPVLSFQLENGFRFIKILSNYLYDKRSLNYATFIEWLNPNYRNPMN